MHIKYIVNNEQHTHRLLNDNNFKGNMESPWKTASCK